MKKIKWEMSYLLWVCILLIGNPGQVIAHKEVDDGAGHKLHPIHSHFGADISGGLTTIIQGSLNNEKIFGGNQTEGSMSADFFLEFPVYEKGSFLFRFDIVQGEGLTSLPPLFNSPNGNTTGTNNDIEGFNSSQLNLNEARYEHLLLNDTLMVVLGQMDITSYFDENNFANDETMHYLAQQFDNNSAIEWGGSENFFGPGLVLLASPTKSLDFSLGWFEGDGDYNEMFRNPFLIGQATLKTKIGGFKGNYRLYAWSRMTPHCKSASDSAIFTNCDSELESTGEHIKIKDSNTGFGLSLDQQISESIGLWARFGYQDPDVSQFDKAVSIGSVISKLIGRPDDKLGIAYGAVFPSNTFENSTGRSDIEHYAEVYYKYVFSGDGEIKGLHITPDFQIITNPGGDSSVDPVFIWGLRTQVRF